MAVINESILWKYRVVLYIICKTQHLKATTHTCCCIWAILFCSCL